MSDLVERLRAGGHDISCPKRFPETSKDSCDCGLGLRRKAADRIAHLERVVAAADALAGEVRKMHPGKDWMYSWSTALAAYDAVRAALRGEG